MFPKALVLIAEGRQFAALDIAATVRDTGGDVAGPVDNVSDGLSIAASESLDGAILDCRLRDGEITPLAELLMERCIPLVLHTNDLAPAALLQPGVPLFRNPTDSLVLARRLAQRIHEERQRSSPLLVGRGGASRLPQHSRPM